jgi:multidrug efflux pump
VLPLALASGAGSGGQNAIGTGVVGGMISATLLAIFFVPLFFVLVLGAVERRPARQAKLPAGAHPAVGE